MYTRRDFSRLALAGAALPAFGKINSKFGGVRIGVQSYSFRTMTLDEAIKAMVDVGIGDCELFSGHAEPAQAAPPGAGRGPEGKKGDAKKGGGTKGGRGPDPEAARAAREERRKWRLTVPLDHFKAIRRKFNDAGITLHAYNLSFREDFTDEEIDRGFQMAKALGVKIITASSTIEAARKVAPFADKHKIQVAMHGHSDIKNLNEFHSPDSFAKALAMSKYFAVNLDIGHFFAAGFDPMEYMKANSRKITNLHIKDRRRNQGENTIWGAGDTPIKQVLQLMREKKYKFPANIEYEYRGSGSPTAEVKKCLDYCKAALA